MTRLVLDGLGAGATRRRFLEVQAAGMARFDARLVSPRGALILVQGRPGGAAIPPVAPLSPAARAALWHELARGLELAYFRWAPPGTQPRLRLEGLELTEANTVLRAEVQLLGAPGRAVRVVLVWVFGPTATVTFLHAGTPEEPAAGQGEFEAVLRSFRFE